HGGIERLEILIEPLLGSVHTTEAEIHKAEKQSSLDCIFSTTLSQGVLCYIRVIVHPCGNCDKRIGEPVSGTGDPQFFGQFLNGAVPNKVDVKVADNAHNSSADCNMV